MTELQPYSAALADPPGELPVPVQSAIPMALPGAAPADPYRVYLDHFGSPASRETMATCLDQMARIILEEEGSLIRYGERITGEGRAWWLLRREHTTKLRRLLMAPERDYSYRTVNKHLSALRGVLKECWRLDLMSTDDWRRAADLEDVKGKREPAGRSIHADEITAMLAVCEADRNRPIGIRDAALITMLQCTGLRAAEITGLLIECYDARERSLKVSGKGNKERAVPVHKDAVPHIKRWLALLGDRRGPMFRSVGKGGDVTTNALHPGTVYKVIQKRRTAAGLPPLGTHDFRRTFGGEFLDAQGDVVQLQQVFGHASVATTGTYDRRAGRGIREAVDRIPIVVPQVSGSGDGGEDAL